MFLAPTTEQEIKNIIDTLKKHKLCMYSDIPVKLINYAANELIAHYT